MKACLSVMLLAVMLGACRDYDLESRLSDQSGLVQPERFARYGREQAQLMAIGREYGHARESSASESPARAAEIATSYARTLPDVTDAGADPLGLRLTIHFGSGWLTMVTPISDGKRGAETAGVPAQAGAGTRR
jgi:hypothetical protein